MQREHTAPQRQLLHAYEKHIYAPVRHPNEIEYHGNRVHVLGAGRCGLGQQERDLTIQQREKIRSWQCRRDSQTTGAAVWLTRAPHIFWPHCERRYWGAAKRKAIPERRVSASCAAMDWSLRAQR